MHFGLEIIPVGPFSDPRKIVKLALAAEAAGWEGIYVWDHVLFGPYGVADPWVALAAVAATTSRLKLCTGVAPMPRYRPHLLARTLSALDLLSQGRVIFGTGLGVAGDFAPFGEPADDKTRAAMTDEGLELLLKLWSGEETTHAGAHYTATNAQLLPAPVQKPHIPIWIGGDSNAALRRAARWDGWIIGTIDEQCNITKTPEKLAAQVAYIREQRTGDAPFDVAIDGVSAAGDRSLPQAYAQAGATWWFEAIFLSRASEEELIRRIVAGPTK